MLKQGASTYQPAAREKGGWRKIKPEYSEGSFQSIDVAIVGMYHGTGERLRRFTYSHFLIAVRSDEGNAEDEGAGGGGAAGGRATQSQGGHGGASGHGGGNDDEEEEYMGDEAEGSLSQSQRGVGGAGGSGRSRPKYMYTFGKVGSGYNYEQLEALNATLAPLIEKVSHPYRSL